MTREQAADLYAEENGDATKFFDYDIARDGFLAGCAHVDREHREFVLMVRQYFYGSDAKESAECYGKISHYLKVFTEREVQSLTFPPSNQE